jgi:hypothetical protein
LVKLSGAAVTAIRERFERAVHAGDLPAGTDCAKLARYLVTNMNDLALQAVIGETEKELRQVSSLAISATNPNSGSWLNIAENELSSMTRRCVAGKRFANIDTLLAEASAWSSDVNNTQRGIDWQTRIRRRAK